jgi:hypothetical protein
MTRLSRNYIALAIVFAFLLVISSTAFAAEAKVLTTKMTSVVVKNDKNGNPYGRMILNQTIEKGGLTFEQGFPVLFFGTNMVNQAVALAADETEVKMALQASEYQGRTSYRCLHIEPVK